MDKPLTPGEFKCFMEIIATNDNQYMRHVMADDLMCEVLTSFGYGEGVEIFEDMHKWYS